MSFKKIVEDYNPKYLMKVALGDIKAGDPLYIDQNGFATTDSNAGAFFSHAVNSTDTNSSEHYHYQTPKKLLKSCFTHSQYINYPIAFIFNLLCNRFENNYGEGWGCYELPYEIEHAGLRMYYNTLSSSIDNQKLSEYAKDKNKTLNIFKDWHPKLTCYLYTIVSVSKESRYHAGLERLMGSKLKQKYKAIIIDKTCNAAAKSLGMIDASNFEKAKTREEYIFQQKTLNKLYPNYMKDLLEVDLNELKL